MNEIPEKFDWVSARGKCSLSLVFLRLREVVESDTNKANELKRQGISFQFRADSEEKFLVGRTVTLSGIPEGEAVVFRLMPNEIQVRHAKSENVTMSAKVHLDGDGNCLLVPNGGSEPLRLWQFSRKALEDLFFGF